MTKFILHGGRLAENNLHNASFFSEFSKTLNEGDTVLFIGFAREDEKERQEIFKRDTGLIQQHTDKKLVFENVELSTLREQVKKASAVFVTGGNTPVLVTALQTIDNELWKELLKNKVVAGSSAGVYVWSEKYFAGLYGEIRAGLGIIPYKTLVHFGNSDFNADRTALQHLIEDGEDTNILVLRDFEWVITHQEL